MGPILASVRKLWILLRRGTFDRELQEEIAFHREQAEREWQAAGVSAEEARYAARRQFGNTTRLQEESRDAVGFRWETAWQDFRYGARQLRTNPGFAATAIFILALGIGATTAIFSAVNPILFQPLPYPQPKRLMMIWEKRSDGGPAHVAFGTYQGLAERDRSFEALAVMKPWQPTVTGPAQPERLEGQRVSAQYLRVLGVAPVLGRDFRTEDDRHRGPNVVILSHALWQRRFGGDPAIVGRQVRLDDNLFTVIGVLPRGFENVLAPEVELWAPLQYNPALPSDGREWGHHLRMVGRLRPGVSREQARNEADVILHTLAQIYAKGFASSGGPAAGFLITPLQSDLTADIRPALLAVLGAVMLVLIIACVNVTNLLLARGAQRRTEFTMRAALGASRTRLVRQLVTESLLLAAWGGALGMLVAVFGVRALVALSPPELPRAGAIRVDGFVFAFGVIVTTLIGVLIGVVPALYASQRDLHGGVQQGSRRATGGHQGARRTLVVAEVALALVLLVSAGLLLRSLQRLFAIDPGFDATHALTMQVQESGRRYDKDDARLRFFEQALQAVRQVPGVAAAGFTSQLPLSGDYDVYGLQFETDYKDNNGRDGALRYAVTTGYFEAMRIPLRRGRYFNERDTAGAPRVAIINESFARRKFGDQDPVGQRVCVRCEGEPDRPWSIIVGVVANVRQLSLAPSDDDAVYIPNSQWYWADNVLTLVVRARGDAAALAPAIRSAIWSVDKDQPIVRVATMQHLLTASEAKRRFALVVFEAFALVALALAATGIYGVLSGSVTERMREIGVRAALGASRANILALVVRQGVLLTALGVVIGVTGAMAASRGLITLLFGVSPLDPVTYVAVVALLAGVSMIGCGVPAWRAARVDPSITLRAE